MSAAVHSLIICAGSNTLPLSRFHEAITGISELLTNPKISEIVTSPDVTGKSSAPYLNAVISGSTQLSFPEIGAKMTSMETAYGRRPDSKDTGMMPLDIDIVVWDEEIIRPEDYARGYFRKCVNTIT